MRERQRTVRQVGFIVECELTHWLFIPRCTGTGSQRSATTAPRRCTRGAWCPPVLKLSSFSCQTFGAAARAGSSGSLCRPLTKSSCKRKLRPRTRKRLRHLLIFLDKIYTHFTLSPHYVWPRPPQQHIHISVCTAILLRFDIFLRHTC